MFSFSDLQSASNRIDEKPSFNLHRFVRSKKQLFPQDVFLFRRMFWIEWVVTLLKFVADIAKEEVTKERREMNDFFYSNERFFYYLFFKLNRFRTSKRNTLLFEILYAHIAVGSNSPNSRFPTTTRILMGL